MPPLHKASWDGKEKPPAASQPKPPRPPAPAPSMTNGAGRDDKVLQALRSGPLGPKAISDATGIQKWNLPEVMDRLTKGQKVRKIGERRGLRYSLV